MTALQQGDVFLFQTLNEGDIIVEEGITQMTGKLQTAGYLALFGGNQGDTGAPDDPKKWWGNIDEPIASRQYQSETQNILDGLPATSGNLNLLQNAAQNDLAFFLEDSIASSVDVIVRLVAPKRVKFDISIEANGEKNQFSFTENWEANQ